MRFDYPSGQGSKSALWDYQNLHDLAEVSAMQRVNDQVSWLFTWLSWLVMGTCLALPSAAVNLLLSLVPESGSAETFPMPPAL